MPTVQTFARSSHDLGAAAWFGGALSDAVSASTVSASSRDRSTPSVTTTGWRPWKLAAVAAHVVGSLALVWGNKSRLTLQQGALTTNSIKTGVFVAAVGAETYATSLARRIDRRRPVAVATSAAPSRVVPDELAGVQRRLSLVRWALVGLTGSNIVLGARMGEEQRPSTLLAGVARRLGVGG